MANIGTSSGNTIGSATGTGSLYYMAGSFNAGFVGIATTGSGTVDCRNNTIAGITTANASDYNTTFWGINCQGTGVGNNFSGNTIDSLTTPGSIYASSASTTRSQNVIGIRGAGTGSVTISGNTIVNLVNGTSSTNNAMAGFTCVIIGTSATINTITGNTVRDLSSASNNISVTNNASVTGIMLTPNVSNAQTVSGNKIYNLSNSYSAFSGAVTGIFFYGSSAGTPTTISGNFIHSLSVTSASSTAAQIRGIMIEDGASTCSNNIISIGGSSNTNLYGI